MHILGMAGHVVVGFVEFRIKLWMRCLQAEFTNISSSFLTNQLYQCGHLFVREFNSTFSTGSHRTTMRETKKLFAFNFILCHITYTLMFNFDGAKLHKNVRSWLVLIRIPKE